MLLEFNDMRNKKTFSNSLEDPPNMSHTYHFIEIIHVNVAKYMNISKGTEFHDICNRNI